MENYKKNQSSVCKNNSKLPIHQFSSPIAPIKKKCQDKQSKIHNYQSREPSSPISINGNNLYYCYDSELIKQNSNKISYSKSPHKISPRQDKKLVISKVFGSQWFQSPSSSGYYSEKRSKRRMRKSRGNSQESHLLESSEVTNISNCGTMCQLSPDTSICSLLEGSRSCSDESYNYHSPTITQRNKRKWTQDSMDDFCSKSQTQSPKRRKTSINDSMYSISSGTKSQEKIIVQKSSPIKIASSPKSKESPHKVPKSRPVDGKILPSPSDRKIMVSFDNLSQKSVKCNRRLYVNNNDQLLQEMYEKDNIKYTNKLEKNNSKGYSIKVHLLNDSKEKIKLSPVKELIKSVESEAKVLTILPRRCDSDPPQDLGKPTLDDNKKNLSLPVNSENLLNSTHAITKGEFTSSHDIEPNVQNSSCRSTERKLSKHSPMKKGPQKSNCNKIENVSSKNLNHEESLFVTTQNNFSSQDKTRKQSIKTFSQSGRAHSENWVENEQTELNTNDKIAAGKPPDEIDEHRKCDTVSEVINSQSMIGDNTITKNQQDTPQETTYVGNTSKKRKLSLKLRSSKFKSKNNSSEETSKMVLNVDLNIKSPNLWDIDLSDSDCNIRKEEFNEDGNTEISHISLIREVKCHNPQVATEDFSNNGYSGKTKCQMSTLEKVQCNKQQNWTMRIKLNKQARKNTGNKKNCEETSEQNISENLNIEFGKTAMIANFDECDCTSDNKTTIEKPLISVCEKSKGNENDVDHSSKSDSENQTLDDNFVGIIKEKSRRKRYSKFQSESTNNVNMSVSGNNGFSHFHSELLENDGDEITTVKQSLPECVSKNKIDINAIDENCSKQSQNSKNQISKKKCLDSQRKKCSKPEKDPCSVSKAESQTKKKKNSHGYFDQEKDIVDNVEYSSAGNNCSLGFFSKVQNEPDENQSTELKIIKDCKNKYDSLHVSDDTIEKPSPSKFEKRDKKEINENDENISGQNSKNQVSVSKLLVNTKENKSKQEQYFKSVKKTSLLSECKNKEQTSTHKCLDQRKDEDETDFLATNVNGSSNCLEERQNTSNDNPNTECEKTNKSPKKSERINDDAIITKSQSLSVCELITHSEINQEEEYMNVEGSENGSDNNFTQSSRENTPTKKYSNIVAYFEQHKEADNVDLESSDVHIEVQNKSNNISDNDYKTTKKPSEYESRKASKINEGNVSISEECQDFKNQGSNDMFMDNPRKKYLKRVSKIYALCERKNQSKKKQNSHKYFEQHESADETDLSPTSDYDVSNFHAEMQNKPRDPSTNLEKMNNDANESESISENDNKMKKPSLFERKSRTGIEVNKSDVNIREECQNSKTLLIDDKSLDNPKKQSERKKHTKSVKETCFVIERKNSSKKKKGSHIYFEQFEGTDETNFSTTSDNDSSYFHEEIQNQLKGKLSTDLVRTDNNTNNSVRLSGDNITKKPSKCDPRKHSEINESDENKSEKFQDSDKQVPDGKFVENPGEPTTSTRYLKTFTNSVTEQKNQSRKDKKSHSYFEQPKDLVLSATSGSSSSDFHIEVQNKHNSIKDHNAMNKLSLSDQESRNVSEIDVSINEECRSSENNNSDDRFMDNPRKKYLKIHKKPSSVYEYSKNKKNSHKYFEHQDNDNADFSAMSYNDSSDENLQSKSKTKSDDEYKTDRPSSSVSKPKNQKRKPKKNSHTLFEQEHTDKIDFPAMSSNDSSYENVQSKSKSKIDFNYKTKKPSLPELQSGIRREINESDVNISENSDNHPSEDQIVDSPRKKLKRKKYVKKPYSVPERDNQSKKKKNSHDHFEQREDADETNSSDTSNESSVVHEEVQNTSDEESQGIIRPERRSDDDNNERPSVSGRRSESDNGNDCNISEECGSSENEMSDDMFAKSLRNESTRKKYSKTVKKKMSLTKQKNKSKKTNKSHTYNTQDTDSSSVSEADCSSFHNKSESVVKNPRNSCIKKSKKYGREQLVSSTPLKRSRLDKSLSGLQNQSKIEEIFNTTDTIVCCNEEEREKLEDLNIQITWELPKLHQIDNGSQHTTFKSLKEMLKAEKVYVDKNKFTKEEENIIVKNWQCFSKEYGFETPEHLIATNVTRNYLKRDQWLKFKQWLARGLPERRLYSVYFKFCTLLTVTNKGRWTAEEDELLMQLYHAYDKEGGQKTFKVSKHVLLQKVLKRTLMSVRRRLEILLRDDHQLEMMQEEAEWSSQLVGKVVHYLLKKTGYSSVEQLRYGKIKRRAWRKVADKLDIPLDRLTNVWKIQLYPKLFAKQHILRNDLLIELITWFYHSSITDWAEINWAKLSRKAADVGGCFLHKTYKDMIRNNVPPKHHKNFEACAEYLFHNYLPLLQERTSGKILNRWKYIPESRIVEDIDVSLESLPPFVIK